MLPIAPNRRNVKLPIFLVISALIAVGLVLGGVRYAYYKPVTYADDWMDSPHTQDPALTNPAYRLSQHPKHPRRKDPVMVLVHGFSASTYEFDAFKTAVTAIAPTMQWSTILMGGHGRNYHAFKDATCDDWQAPLVEEVNALIQLGYTRITLVGVSTGATVIMDALLRGLIDATAIESVIMVDPFLSPRNKWLYAIPYLKRLIPNTMADASTPLAHAHWYTNRPAEALNQLRILITRVARLQQTAAISVPTTVYLALNDPICDTQYTQKNVSIGFPKTRIHTNESNHHVIIEPNTKASVWTPQDQTLFDTIIHDIVTHIKISLTADG